jgi:hypothetical protein
VRRSSMGPTESGGREVVAVGRQPAVHCEECFLVWLGLGDQRTHAQQIHAQRRGQVTDTQHSTNKKSHTRRHGIARHMLPATHARMPACPPAACRCLLAACLHACLPACLPLSLVSGRTSGPPPPGSRSLVSGRVSEWCVLLTATHPLPVADAALRCCSQSAVRRALLPFFLSHNLSCMGTGQPTRTHARTHARNEKQGCRPTAPPAARRPIDRSYLVQ